MLTQQAVLPWALLLGSFTVGTLTVWSTEMQSSRSLALELWLALSLPLAVLPWLARRAWLSPGT
jgi:hypothetical protein